MPTGKSTYHHGTLYRALLDAGEDVLRDCGLRGFTLRECARRAGVSHSAPKHHFGDVQGFLTEIAALGFDRLTGMLRQEIAGATDLEQEFIATSRAYVAFAEQNPEHFRIMFRCDLLNVDAPVLANAAHKTYRELTNVILRQRGDPELPEQIPEGSIRFASFVDDIVIGWCHIHGLAHLKLEQQFPALDPDGTLLINASRRLSKLIQSRE